MHPPNSLQVLGRPNSINVRKVLWLCAELDIPFEHQPWGYGELALQSPEFLALNPNALVPVIRHGSLVLWESNTICRYLAAQHQRHDLLPLNPRERAGVEQWMDWQATELNNAWRYAFLALVRKSPAHNDSAATAASEKNWHRHMAILEAQLAQTQAYVAGANFTLADIVLGLSVNRWLMTPMQRPALPAVAAYVERLAERPAYALHSGAAWP
jgi:glutathione S-transferase